MEIIRRQMYLDHIISVMNKNMMLVLVGQRRVGKSYILLDLKRWIEENEPASNIVYLDKEHEFLTICLRFPKVPRPIGAVP